MNELTIKYMAITDLKPYEKNARKHEEKDISAIMASIREFGFDDPVGIWSDENIIVEGHGRVMAAQRLGMTEVPCIRLDHLTDEQRRAYALAHNRTAELSEWDLIVRDDELQGITEIDMEQFGFDISEIEEPAEAVEDDYDGDVPEEPKAKLGDLYQLGEHRLICGDSTDVNVIDRLMDGQKADMVFTDPPYGVGVSGGSGGKGKDNRIMGDVTQTAIPFSFDIAVNIATKPKAHIYFCGAESNLMMYQKLFDKYLQILPKHLIWVKNGFSMKQNGYHNQYEVIFFGYKRGSGALWYGGRTEDEASDVWQIKRDSSTNYLHPTQKPIEIPSRAIKNSCPTNGSVVDLFGGSGSTLIACEQLNRRCFMCELDPHYVDVIIDRWEKFTGEKAVLLNEEGSMENEN